MSLPGARGCDFETHERRRLGCPLSGIDQQRKRAGHRSAAIAALLKRASAPEHQQSTTAAIDELGNHLQLIAREGARLYTPEDEAAVREQLLTRFRESSDDLFRVG